MTETSWRTHRARIASLSRSRSPDDPDLVDAYRALREARLVEAQRVKELRLTDYIRNAIESDPPLTMEQRERLALLLELPSTT